MICNDHNIELVLFIAPTSSQNRINTIAKKSPGCIYLVSATGVTGVRNSFDNRIADLANYVKTISDKVIMLGFGVSTPDHVETISRWSIDGIVVGSAFVKRLSKDHEDGGIESLSSLCKSLKSATNK